MQNASSTRRSLRLPIEQMVPICERAQENGSTLFSYVAQRIESRLTLNGMNFNMPESCEHLRVTLTLPLDDAIKLRREAQAKRLSAADWIAQFYSLARVFFRPENLLGAPSREPTGSHKHSER
jgi:hypothetical protein